MYLMPRNFRSTYTKSFQHFISFSVQSGGIVFETIMFLSILLSSGAFWCSDVNGLHVFQDMNVCELILSVSKFIFFFRGYLNLSTRFFTILVENLGKTVQL